LCPLVLSFFSFSTQFLFILPLLVFAYLTYKQEGALFYVPGIKETKTSLNQPFAIRSVPWLGVVSAVLLYPIQGLATALYAARSEDIPAVVTAMDILLPLVIGLLISYGLAKKVKEGRRFWIALLVLVNLIFLVPGYTIELIYRYLPQYFPAEAVFDGIYDPSGAPDSTGGASLVLFNLALSLWYTYVFLRYGGRMVADGKNYREEAGVSIKPAFSWVPKKAPELYLGQSFLAYAVYNMLNLAGKTIFTSGDLQTSAGVTTFLVVGLFSAAGGLFFICGLTRLVQELKEKRPHLLGWAVAVAIIAGNIFLSSYASR
jgi:hypothetical protein